MSLLNTIVAYPNSADSTADMLGVEEQQRNGECVQEAAIYLHYLYGASNVTASIFARELLAQGNPSLAEEALRSCVVRFH
jgi:hypothetical protein